MVSAYFGKSPTNPAVQNDADVQEYLAWKAKYCPEGDVNDVCLDYSYMQAHLLLQVLKQCGDDLTRENVMRQAQNLKNVRIPLLAPGITIDTSPTDYRPIQSMRFMRFDGRQWNYFGALMTEKQPCASVGSSSRHQRLSSCRLQRTLVCRFRLAPQIARQLLR